MEPALSAWLGVEAGEPMALRVPSWPVSPGSSWHHQLTLKLNDSDSWVKTESKSLFPNSHNFSLTLCHRELLQFVLSTESKRYESTWLAWGGGGERGKGFASVLPPCHRAHRDTCFLPDSRDKAQPHHPRSLSSLGHSVAPGEGAWSVRLKSAAEGGRVTAQGDEAPGGGRLLQERIIRTGRILSDRGYKTSSSGGSEFSTPVQCWIFW